MRVEVPIQDAELRSQIVDLLKLAIVIWTKGCCRELVGLRQRIGCGTLDKGLERLVV